MATEKEVLKLDLDAAEFLEAAKGALEAIQKIGESRNLTGLVEGLTMIGKTLAIITVAVGAFKTALAAVEEAENIERINKQFDLLASNAGVAGNTIREKLVGAAGGLADDTEIIQAANRAVIALGQNADKLPEIMELARKATAVVGGELTSTFETMSSAIAAGNARILRQYGIVVDMEKAQAKYAMAIGITVGQLTEQQKKEALLNEVLSKRETAFKGVEEASGSVTVLIKKIGVEIGQSLEAIGLWVNKIIGPTFRSIFGALKDNITGIRLFLESRLGDASKKAEADLEILRRKQASIGEEIEKTIAQEKRWGAGPVTTAKIERLRESYEALGKQIEAAEEHKKSFEAEGPAAARPKDDTLERQAIELLAKERETQSKILEIREQTAMSEVEVADIVAQRKLAIQQQLQAQIDELKVKAAKGEVADIAGQEALLREQAAAKIMQVNDQLAANQEAALNRQQKANTTFYSGWKNQSAQASVALSKDQMNWAKAGAFANETLTKTMAAGFINISKGSKEALKAMKQQFFLLIADKAQAEGMLHLAAGLLNPVEFGVGGALLALSGLIRGFAGGDLGSAGGGGAPSGGGMGGAMGAEPPPITSAAPELPADAGKPQKTVTIAIQGNYFETEATKRTLMEMIRAETDATEFRYVQIPQSG
jgi:hypothetical protein